jgi:hypothetical protein
MPGPVQGPAPAPASSRQQQSRTISPLSLSAARGTGRSIKSIIHSDAPGENLFRCGCGAMADGWPEMPLYKCFIII